MLFRSIPVEIGDLTNLTDLTLSHNHLSGEIPSDLGSLSSLRHLRLSSNSLTGCIPAALIDVRDNDMASLGLPSCAASSAFVDQCSSGTAVPEPASNPGLVSDCTNLLAALDSFTSRSTALKLNWSAGRSIREWDGVTVASTVGSAARVENLDLGLNQMSGEIPSELGSLSSLRQLDIGSNFLTGEIPSELGDLTNLTQL